MPTFRDAAAADLYAELTEGSTPISLAEMHGSDGLELTMLVEEGCNLACTYCFANLGEYGHVGTKLRMTPEGAEHVLRNFASQAVRIS